MGKASRRRSRLGHGRVGERVGDGESVSEVCGNVGERDGRESLSGGLHDYMLVVRGNFVDSRHVYWACLTYGLDSLSHKACRIC